MHPKQWRCPLNQKGDVTKVLFSNKRTHLSMEYIAYLLDFMFSSPDHVNPWEFIKYSQQC